MLDLLSDMWNVWGLVAGPTFLLALVYLAARNRPGHRRLLASGLGAFLVVVLFVFGLIASS